MASLIRPSYEPNIPCAVKKFRPPPLFWTAKVNYTVHKGHSLVHSIVDYTFLSFAWF